MKKSPLVVVPLLASFVLPAAFAMSNNFYVQASAGYSSLDTPTGRVFEVDSPSSSTEMIIEDYSKSDQGGMGGGLLLGYQLNSTWALELEYMKYATSEYESQQTNYDSSSGDIEEGTSNTATLDYKSHSYNLLLKGLFALGDKLDVFAKAGLALVEQQSNYNNPSSGDPSISLDGDKITDPGTGDITSSAIRPAVAAGITYHVNNKVAVSAFTEQVVGSGDFSTDSGAIADASFYGLGLTIHF